MPLLTNLVRRVRLNAAGGGHEVEALTGRVRQPLTPLPANFLTDKLRAQDRKLDDNRLGNTGNIHVSALLGFCERRHVIVQKYSDPQDKISSAHGGMRVVWEMGKAAEHHVRKQLIAADRQNVYGRWTCMCERTVRSGFWAAAVCAKCDTPLDVYKELPLLDAEAGVIGNPDIQIRANGALVVGEIKSMNKKDWDKLEAPLGDHKFQAAWYVNVQRRNGITVHDDCRALYVTKDYVHGSPYKEYSFNAMEPSLMRQVETSRVWAKEAHSALAENRIPARRVCASPTDSIAKQCPVVAACFNRS